jgi:Glycosyl hydrolase family 76
MLFQNVMNQNIMNPLDEKTVVYGPLKRLEQWVEQADWSAYDTFDGLASPYARLFTFGSGFLKQVWQQSVRRSPVNLRPLLGITPSKSTKAMGFFAQGYLKLYETYADQAALGKGRSCLKWLVENRSKPFRNYCWGNHFDYQSRGGGMLKGTPTIVWTGLIGHAFLDAYDVTEDEEYLAVANSVCDFIVEELGWFEGEGGMCLRYYPNEEHQIHNSNMIGASLLARVNALSPDSRYSETARGAVDFTVRHQTAEGAWFYGVEQKYKWVDSFHTGYVLEALDSFIRYSGDSKHGAALEKGYQYFVETFFEEDGTPRYYDYKRRPLDIQCASQGIQTLVNLRRLHPQSVAVANKVAQWAIANMQDPTGYFYYRKYPLITNKTPTLHWGQATMFAALALLDQHLRSQSGAPPAIPPSNRAMAMLPQSV